MRRKLLLILLSTMLCTSCDYEPLFFKTNKEATLEEVKSFIDNIHAYDSFIPDGWYEYKKIITINGVESITYLKFYIKNIDEDDTTNNHYIITHLIGNTSDGKSKFYCNDKVLITETTNNKGVTKRYGSTKARFVLNDLFFSEMFYWDIAILSNDYYIKDNSISAFSISYTNSYYNNTKFSIGVNYNNDFTKIVRGRELWNNVPFNVNGELVYVTTDCYIFSCEPVEISFDENYDVAYHELFDQIPI